MTDRERALEAENARLRAALERISENIETMLATTYHRRQAERIRDIARVALATPRAASGWRCPRCGNYPDAPQHEFGCATPVAPAPAAIEAAVRAEQAAEVERLTAALKLAVEFVDRVQQFGRLTRADAVAPGPMEMSAAVLATTLRAALAATPVAPAPNQPAADERCVYRGKFEGRACVRPAGHTGAHSSIEPCGDRAWDTRYVCTSPAGHAEAHDYIFQPEPAP